MQFRPAAELTPEAVAAITERVRVRVLRWFVRSGVIEANDVGEVLAWENSGVSSMSRYPSAHTIAFAWSRRSTASGWTAQRHRRRGLNAGTARQRRPLGGLFAPAPAPPPPHVTQT